VSRTDPVVDDVARRLIAAGCVAAKGEAAELVAAAPDARVLDAWVGRRESGEPLAWITGRVRFCGRTLRVEPGVYVPSPQTEELARRAALLPDRGRNGVPTVIADLATAVRYRACFDVVTAVAPCVPTGEIRLLPSDVQQHEPRVALDGGNDGLDLVRRVVEAASRLLRSGGWLLLEVGADQHTMLACSLEADDFDETTLWRDDGDLRVRPTGGPRRT
jgi:release factor glutamine methyltransferase